MRMVVSLHSRRPGVHDAAGGSAPAVPPVIMTHAQVVAQLVGHDGRELLRSDVAELRKRNGNIMEREQSTVTGDSKKKKKKRAASNVRPSTFKCSSTAGEHPGWDSDPSLDTFTQAHALNRHRNAAACLWTAGRNYSSWRKFSR